MLLKITIALYIYITLKLKLLMDLRFKNYYCGWYYFTFVTYLKSIFFARIQSTYKWTYFGGMLYTEVNKQVSDSIYIIVVIPIYSIGFFCFWQALIIFIMNFSWKSWFLFLKQLGHQLSLTFIVCCMNCLFLKQRS